MKDNKLPFFTRQVVKYFGFFMVIFYVVLGFLFIFFTEFFPELNRKAKLIFGVALVIYGIFRAYRTIKSINYDNQS